MRTIILILLFISFTTTACSNQLIKKDSISVRTNPIISNEKLPLVEDRAIKNVIFIIGDGTGLAQLYSGQVNLVGADGRLNVQKMPITGIVNTHSADRLITDSASSATAYSCGVKTNNGMIGQLPDGRICKTILEMAEEKGKSTGLIATSTITHATPASYASHVVSRGMQDVIAEQYLTSGVEVLLGGGSGYFIPQSQTGSSRKDDLDLISDFQDIGYEFVENIDALKTSQANKILGLFSPSGMPSEPRTPTLSEMTEKALDVLNRNENGFFLMVEGSQIDWAGHDNDAAYALRELSDFDAAIKTALDFALSNGETLVIVTADHETGGMSILSGDTEDELNIVWTTGYHSGIPVPLMAFGPHAIEFSGWLDNTEVGIKVAEVSGLGNLPVIID